MRNFGRIVCRVWLDPDFRTLQIDEQWLYLMLVTQSDISSAGVLGMTVRRWTGYASDAAYEGLSKALTGLVAKRFVLVDDDTEELLVRTFVKHDGGWNNWRRAAAIRAARDGLVSPVLRGVLVAELEKLGLAEGPCDSPSHSPSDSPSDRASHGLSHSPRMRMQDEDEDEKTRARRRGTRLPADWKRTEADVAWQRSEKITDAVARRETEKFRDHFAAATGSNAVKLDWSAAWRNWMRRATDSTAPRTPATPPVGGW